MNKLLRRKSTGSTVASIDTEEAIDDSGEILVSTTTSKQQIIVKEEAIDIDNTSAGSADHIINELDISSSSDKSESPVGVMDIRLTSTEVPPPPLTDDDEHDDNDDGLLVDFPNRRTSMEEVPLAPTRSISFKDSAKVQSVENYSLNPHLKSQLWYNEVDLRTFQRNKGQDIGTIRMLHKFNTQAKNNKKKKKQQNAEFIAQQLMIQKTSTSIGLENHVGHGKISWNKMTLLREQHRKAVLIEQWKQCGEFCVVNPDSIAKASMEKSEWARVRGVEIGNIHTNYDKDGENDDESDDSSSSSSEGEGAIDWEDGLSIESVEVRELLMMMKEMIGLGDSVKSELDIGDGAKKDDTKMQRIHMPALMISKTQEAMIAADKKASTQVRKEIDNLRASISLVKHKSGSHRSVQVRRRNSPSTSYSHMTRGNGSLGLLSSAETVPSIQPNSGNEEWSISNTSTPPSSNVSSPRRRPRRLPPVPHNTPNEPLDNNTVVSPEDVQKLRRSVQLKMSLVRDNSSKRLDRSELGLPAETKDRLPGTRRPQQPRTSLQKPPTIAEEINWSSSSSSDEDKRSFKKLNGEDCLRSNKEVPKPHIRRPTPPSA